VQHARYVLPAATATLPGFRDAAGHRQRAAEIRAMADAIDAQFGKGPG
jgi:hypothetical protein